MDRNGYKISKEHLASLYKIIQVFFILTTRELSVNRIDFQALTLAGPPRANPGSGPPNWTPHLDNRLLAGNVEHELKTNDPQQNGIV